jgi:site-specific recombinase XerD
MQRREHDYVCLFHSTQEPAPFHEGPLGLHLDVFAARLLKEGHCQQSGWRILRVVGDYSRWLARKGLSLPDVTESTVEQYQRFRRRHRSLFCSDRAALLRLLAVLREVDAIAPLLPTPRTEHEQIEDDFKEYLLRERGLRQVTIIRHLPPLRLFLREHCRAGRASVSGFTTADITGFIVRHAHDQSPRSARSMCWTVRAFMRYLQYKGWISTDLAASVPSTRQWRLQALPGYLAPSQVKQVLDRIDRRDPLGRRDYAIVLLLARLGLRANEIATMALDDIDWQTGQITIRGKGRRRALMPLPAEVGAAIADYLQNGRPTSGWETEKMVRRYAHLAVGHLGVYADNLQFHGTILAQLPAPQKGSGASADNSPNSTSEALRVALVSDEKWLEMSHL